MIRRFIVPLVAFSHRHAWLVALAGLLLTLASGFYAASHIKMDTDESHLISADIPWRQRAIALYSAFPQEDDLLVVVVDAPSADEAEAATRKLTAALATNHTDFKYVQRPDGGPFFQQEGLLLLDTKDVKAILDKTVESQPLLGQLTGDPTARGLFAALATVAQGAAMGATSLTPLEPALKAIDASLDSLLQGHPRPLAWQSLLSADVPRSGGTQHLILVQPEQDFTQMQPGHRASETIRAAAVGLGYAAHNEAADPDKVRVRITGPIALSDEEAASAAEGTVSALLASTALVIVWLLMALRSPRLIVAIFLTLVAGFVITAGFAALSVGTLNLISIAFAVLFIGLAVDFSIQFSVRYRDERHHNADMGLALAQTARGVGAPIAVAAAATAAGFYSFLPTDFKGVSELGLIAGTGMLIAFACNMTLLPALLTLVRPKGESEPVGYRWPAPIEAALQRRPWPVLLPAMVVAVLGFVLVPRLHFDFDPLHLKNQSAESVSTLNELMKDPLNPPYSAALLEPTLADADAMKARMEKLPEVAYAIDLDTFIPADQDTKLAMIADAAEVMDPTLDPPAIAPAPGPGEIRAAMAACGEQLAAALAKAGPNPAAQQLAADLKKAAALPDQQVAQLTAVLISSLPDRLNDLKLMLDAKPITIDTLPAEIKRDWITQDGRARVEIFPKGDSQQNAVLKAFYDAVKAVAPEVSGPAATILQSSETIVGAFKTAGISAFVVISLILLAALRRPGDVALVLAPLILASLLTVIYCVLRPFPLNFANIIALPLLLGVGVAFDIYFVMNWRAGETHPLQSPTARAVLFSALTTGTAFGSLALSHHPGTATMGKLLIISLAGTLLCTMIVLPAMLVLANRRKAKEKK